MPRPICAHCSRFMRPKKNGVVVHDHGDYWMADLWECKMCQHEMITGFGREPIASPSKGDPLLWQKFVDYHILG